VLVDQVVKMLQSTIQKNVIFDLDLNQDVPEILGDSGQIQQIAMNLIINSAEAIGNARGTIRVTLTEKMYKESHLGTDVFGTLILAGRYACLEVTDTGIGMDEETRKRIFEPFFTTKFTGRGLGMSAINSIITSHRGLLLLKSEPGLGTTFKVCFPVPDAFEIFSDVSDPLPQSVDASGTILLVDDEESLRNMGTLLLEALGFTAMTAQHGREAVDIYRELGSEIDVILMDLIMPEMGGIEAYHELRKIDLTIPIVISSGYGVESIADVIDNDTHAAFVHKPYHPNELRNVMIQMMSQAV
jgi:CheY-like chemotaxis protein